MNAMGVISIDELEQLAGKNEEFKNGCLVDSNVLLSVSLTIDPMNSRAEALIQRLEKLKIPLYSNVNIRAEFLEIQRRVLIPETLIEFYESNTEDLDEVLTAKLRSIQTSYREAIKNKKVYKFSDDRIKEIRTLFSSYAYGGKNAWNFFCENFLAPQLESVWDEVVKICRLNFIKIRDGEKQPLLISKVSWDGVTQIMGRYGLGSADSMILNLLLSSKLLVVATADGDIQYTAKSLGQKGKFVLEI